MASSTRTTSPAATSAPASTLTATTVPGIGASSEPLATASAGSVKRGTSRRRDGPIGPVDVHLTRAPSGDRTTISPRVAAATPSTSSRAWIGDTSRTVTPSTANPSRVPHHSTGSCPSNVVRCGWLRTLRQAAGTPCWTVRRAASSAASISAPATSAVRSVDGESPGDSAEIGRDSSHVVVISPATNTGSVEDLDELVAVGRHTVDAGPAECRDEHPDRLLAGRRPRDHLGEHRVVEGGDLVARREAGVDPDARRRPAAELGVGGRSKVTSRPLCGTYAASSA